MAVTHIIPKVKTSKASEIRDHQGSATRLRPVNLKFQFSNYNWQKILYCYNDTYNIRQKTYLPNNVHSKGSDKKITMTTIVNKMLRFPKE